MNTGEEQAIARRGLANREGARSTMRDALLTESRKTLMADKLARDDLRGSDDLRRPCRLTTGVPPYESECPSIAV